MSRWNLTQDKILTERQANKLLKVAREALDATIASKENIKYLNDFFLIALGWNTGLRASEMSSLQWGDFNTEDHYLLVREGKGGKKRTVQFGQSTSDLILEFQALQRTLFRQECLPGDDIFINQRRARLKRGGIHLRIKYWFSRAGLPESLSYHSLRHGFATRLINHGIPINVVRDQLGHANVNITMTYLHFTEDSKRALERII